MKDYVIDSKAVRKRMIDVDITTLSSLSEKSGISRPSLYELLDSTSPFTNTFTKLFECLDVDPLDLLVESDSSVEQK